MSQQVASRTRPYRGLVLDRPTHALVSLIYPNSAVPSSSSLSLEQKSTSRDVWLTQKLLAAIRSIAGNMFVFQQDNATAHRARDTVELLRRETPQLISPCGKPTVLTSTR